jgi:hypothetical protein
MQGRMKDIVERILQTEDLQISQHSGTSSEGSRIYKKKKSRRKEGRTKKMNRLNTSKKSVRGIYKYKSSAGIFESHLKLRND